jgi:hypothetical protein
MFPFFSPAAAQYSLEGDQSAGSKPKKKATPKNAMRMTLSQKKAF